MSEEDLRITGNIIRDFTKIAEIYLDSPMVFIKVSAYWLASSTIGRFIQDSMTPNQMRPNLFIILSSVPGRTRRSAVLGLVRKVYTKALMTFFKLRGFPPTVSSELDYYKAVSDTILEEGTAEGLTDHLRSVETYHYGGAQGDMRLFSHEPKPIIPETFVLIHPEIGMFISRMHTLTYLTNVLSLFSKLYDSEGGRVYLSQRGRGQPRRYLPWNIYFTSLGAMQEPQQYLDEYIIRQGLLRRILLVYYDVQKPEKSKELEDRWKPLRNVDRGLLNRKVDELGEFIGRKMKELDDICRKHGRPIEPIYEPEAFEFVQNIEKTFDVRILNRVDEVSIYEQSYPEKIEKMTLLNALCRRWADKSDGTFIVTYSSNEKHGDFAEPILLIENIMMDVEEVLMSLKIKKEPVKSKQPLEDLVRFYIESSGREGITLWDLRKKIKTSTEELWNCLKTYMTPLDKPEIVVIKYKKQRGRPVTIFISTKFLTEEEVKKIVKEYDPDFKSSLEGDSLA